MVVPSAAVQILDPGFLTTVQDLPRYGLARYGLSEAGAMAPLSLLEANWLAGNGNTMPSLEVTMKPPRLLFLQDARLGIAGADFGWQIDERPISNLHSADIRKGETLHGNYCRNGLRAYIAVAGGFSCQAWYESASTHVQSGFGGMRLKRASSLTFAGSVRLAPHRKRAEVLHLPLTNGTHKVIRLVQQPTGSPFAPEALSLFTGSVYRVTEQSNRMALRLEGLSIPAPREPMLSSGAWQGAVQVPPSGVPQILGPEHPATGGYPILASVIQADWETLGQLRPREEIRFGRVSMETAIQLLRRQRALYSAMMVNDAQD